MEHFPFSFTETQLRFTNSFLNVKKKKKRQKKLAQLDIVCSETWAQADSNKPACQSN